MKSTTLRAAQSDKLASVPPCFRVFFTISPRRKSQRRRVDAVAQAGRLRPVGEDVTEMAVATAAMDFCARISEVVIGRLGHALFRRRLVIARPTRSAVIFVLGIEKFLPAAGAPG